MGEPDVVLDAEEPVDIVSFDERRQPEFVGEDQHVDDFALAEHFGDAYLSVAMAAHVGEHRGLSSETFEQGDLPLQPAVEGSLEAMLLDHEAPLLAIDLRRPGADDALGDATWFRTVGNVSTEEQFARKDLPESFDWIFWVEETSAQPAID